VANAAKKNYPLPMVKRLEKSAGKYSQQVMKKVKTKLVAK
jgi:hypothetical protein